MKHASMSNGPIDAEHHKRVRGYFNATVRLWRDVYARDDLASLLYWQRTNAALSVVDSLEIPLGARVLEIGCGAGLASVALAKRRLDVHVVDSATKMIATAQRLAASAGVAVRALAADVHQLPFADARFDLVLALGVCEWLASLEEPLAEMSRVLVPGGHLIVSTDNRWAMHRIVDPLLFPMLAPIKRVIRRSLERVSRSGRTARAGTHSIRTFDSSLRAAGLSKMRGATLGFGPISLFRLRPIPDPAAKRIHGRLQRFADDGVPLLRSAGHVYLVLARK